MIFLARFESDLLELINEYLRDGMSSLQIIAVMQHHCDKRELLEREIELQSENKERAHD